VSGNSLRHVSLFLCLLGPAVGAVGCGGTATTSADQQTASPDESTMRITFAGKQGSRLTASDVQVTGNIPVVVQLASSEDGSITAHGVDVEGVHDPAARFPAFDAGMEAPASAVLVSSSSSDDRLNPGVREFSFGATVRLDAKSESHEPDPDDSADNGNNVLQKGLYLDPSQYKLQVDHGFASCRVAGRDGALDVRSQVAIEPLVWYRVACARSDDTLTITVDELTVTGSQNVDRQVAQGRTGHVSTEERSRYLSLGAKVDARGAIPEGSTDQFNGLVGDLFVTIRGRE